MDDDQSFLMIRMMSILYSFITGIRFTLPLFFCLCVEGCALLLLLLPAVRLVQCMPLATTSCNNNTYRRIMPPQDREVNVDCKRRRDVSSAVEGEVNAAHGGTYRM